MNEMTITTSATMTSREIADLVGSRHDKVKQSIERLANRKNADGNPASVIDLSPMGEYLDTLGRPATHYVFTGEKGKRDSYVVVAQLSPEFTAKLVDRWQELEAGQFKVPSNFADALRLAADQQEKIALLALENHRQAEKIDVLENLLAKGVSAPEFCRHLNGVNTQAVNRWLKDKGWLFESGGQYCSWRVSSYARDQYMTERALEVTGSQGPFSISKPVLLRKGARWLIHQYMQGRLPMKKTWDGVFKHDITGVLEVAV